MDEQSNEPPAWAVRFYEGILEQIGLHRAETAAQFSAHRAETAAGFKSVQAQVEMLNRAVDANSADLRDVKATLDHLEKSRA